MVKFLSTAFCQVLFIVVYKSRTYLGKSLLSMSIPVKIVGIISICNFNQGSKGIRQLDNKLMYNPNGNTPSVDYNKWLKRLDN